MFQEALESRSRAIEEEITRLLKLSVETDEPREQDNYLRLAQDLQREARELVKPRESARSLRDSETEFRL